MSFSIPGYHDIILFAARLRVVKFGGTESNSKLIRKLYRQMGEHSRRKNINNWLFKLSNSYIRLGEKRYFILYPPYWYVGADQISKSSKMTILNWRKAYNSEIFDTVFAADMPKETVKFALDNRHFLSGEMIFKNTAVKARLFLTRHNPFHLNFSKTFSIS